MLKGHVFDEQLFASEIFAVFTNTFLDGENGVVQGFGNSMAVTTNGNDLTVQSGVVCIQGRFLQEDTSSTIIAGTTPAYARLIVEINLNEINTESTFLQGTYKVITDNSTYPTLTQTDIVNNVSGIYQYSLGRFQITTNGITNYVDERTYLDFNSIYEEIREKIHDIEDESIYVLKEDYEIDKAGLEGIELYSGTLKTGITLSQDKSNFKFLRISYSAQRSIDGDVTQKYWQGTVLVPAGASNFVISELVPRNTGTNLLGSITSYTLNATSINALNHHAWEIGTVGYSANNSNAITITKVEGIK